VIGRRGVTLIELLVVLVLLGILSGVVVMSITTTEPPAQSKAIAEVRDARERALRSGRPVAITLRDDSGSARPMVALPDGSVIADSALRLDRLAGKSPSEHRAQ